MTRPVRVEFVPGPYRTHIFVVLGRRLVVLCILVALFGAMILMVVLYRGKLGDLSPRASRLARQHAEQPFDAAAWRAGDEEVRGEMLASLAQRHRLAGVHRDSVVQLLGRYECYVHYEDEPCYYLKLGDRRYELRFSVNHSSAPGQILSVKLAAAP